MKKDTQKPFQDQARQTRRTRKALQLDKETLRLLNGGGGATPDSPTTRPSQCPTLCF